MNKTKIPWCDYTWNPITGCSPVSEGCENCYARAMAKRFNKGDFSIKFHPERISDIEKLKWSNKIFVCSTSDLFHHDVFPDWLYVIFHTIRKFRYHTFMILTKRPVEMEKFIKWFGSTGMIEEWPIPNLWIGVTAENQQRAEERIPVLLRIPAVKRFVSIEPMLGPVDLENLNGNANSRYQVLTPIIDAGDSSRPSIDWVICGGETGPKARPMHPDWPGYLKDQCKKYRVPFFFKQQGAWNPFYDRDIDDPDWKRIPIEGKNIRKLNLAGGQGFHGDRVIYFKRTRKSIIPEDLNIREFPKC